MVLDYFHHKTFRPHQKETILEIAEELEKGTEYIILESPTGSGKSAIAVTLGLHFQSAFLLTSQKILQDQYIKDYSSERVCVLKGRSNYPCKLFENSTCEDSYCSIKECHIKTECFYEIAKQRAINSYVALMNYKYFLCIMNYTTVFSKRKLLICDEAHSLDDECMSFVEFSFSSFYLSKLGVTSKIPIYEKLEEYIDWLQNILQKISNLEIKIKERLKKKFTSEEEKINLSKELEGLTGQKEKIKTFLDSHSKVEWIFDIVDNEKTKTKTIVFKPLTIGFFAEQLIFRHSDTKILMSATILDHENFCRNLGIDITKTKFIRVPSTFSKDIRPIILTRTGSMGKNDLDGSLPKIAEDIGRILEFHDDVKGLIHTQTYKIANYIKENIGSKFEDRLILHDSDSREHILKIFIESDEPKVLVTPSMTEGIDLKDDLARFVVIVKLPYMFLGDKQIKKRMEIDKEWYLWKTALTLVQAAGRGVRHENDFCTIYIMDSQFNYFLKQNRKFFPNYFVEAIKN